MAKCPSFQGILDVAEAEEGMIVVPDILEGAKAEIVSTVRVAIHKRHPGATVGIPETIRFIERHIPFAFRQLVTLLFEDEGCALCACVDGLLSCQERHALLARGDPVDDLLECANAELVTRLQNTRRIGEVLVGYVAIVVIVVIKLFTVLLTERRKPLLMHVVVGHYDNAEVHKQSELPRQLDRICADDIISHRFVLSL